MKWINYNLLCVLLVVLVNTCNSLGDPYKVLGIPKSSTVTEIRKAYKQLAKEWHPDKNDDPAAEDKFVEITQAYELLTDPERRKQFDSFGRILNEPRPRREYRQYDPVDDLFSGAGFRFQYSDRDITLFHKLSITTRAYENNLVPKSWRTPYLILFYSDWCFACLQVEPVWRRIMEELEPIGVGIATAHAENEPMLARRVSVHSLPCLVLLIDGRPIVYKESLFSVQKVVEFVRNKLPYRLIQNIADDGLDNFLSGWIDNKVRALVFQRNGPVRLRYLLTAFAYRERVAFGFVQTNTAKGEAVRARLQVPPDMDSLLLFNENTERPVASVSMINIPVQTLQDIINSNKYLLLPRLSSQDLLDALCPASASPRKRLCVLLVSQNTPYHEPHRQSLRRFAQETNYADKVCFMYIFQERQVEFVHALLSGENSPLEPLVAILWRRDQKHIKYEWLPEGQDWASYNTTRQHLEPAIERLLRATQAMPHEAVIGELIDESAQGFLSRMLTRLLVTYDMLRDNLDKEHILPAVSIFATISIILAAGWLMSYLMKLEETRVKEEYNNNPPKNGKASKAYQPTLKLHELRAETYNGLVRLLRPGCRTVLLLTDTQSRPVLLPAFHRAVWPYRRNKTLLFGYLMLERSINWYKEILQLSMSGEARNKPLNINPRNCIGTVIALNGMRKYFCVYHAKHPECLGMKGNKRMKRMTKHLSIDPAGAFMGFDNSDSDDSDLSDVEQGLRTTNQNGDKYSQVIFQENLLDGLPNWLDRMFEGSTQRYYINFWPDYTCK